MNLIKTLYLCIIFLVSCKNSIEDVSAYPNKLNFQKKEIIQRSEVMIHPQNQYKPSTTYNHISYIRNKSKKGETDGKGHKIEYFIDYVILKLLQNPKDVKYITDRILLHKLQMKSCLNNYVLIEDTLTTGETCIIEIKTQPFDTMEHIIKHRDEYTVIQIDGKKPYGAIYGKQPENELESLTIKIDGVELDTKILNYKNIYEPNFCEYISFMRKVEAFEDGENIYIYIYGGVAADTYFCKLIFDRKGYVTSIISDYVPLSMYGCFRSDFSGF